MALVVQPRMVAIDPKTKQGMPYALASFTLTGTTTPVLIYQDVERTVEHTNPVQADVGGTFPAVYADPSDGDLRCRVIAQDGSLADPVYDTDPVESGSGDIANAQLADMPAGTFKANLTGAEAKPGDYSIDEASDALRYAGETDQGMVVFAALAEAGAGTVTDKAVTPAGLEQFWTVKTGTEDMLLAQTGYRVNSDGSIDQWGRTAVVAADGYVDVVFPKEFPTECWNFQHSPRITDAYTLRYDSWSLAQGTPSTTGCRIYCASSANDKPVYIDWRCLGN